MSEGIPEAFREELPQEWQQKYSDFTIKSSRHKDEKNRVDTLIGHVKGTERTEELDWGAFDLAVLSYAGHEASHRYYYNKRRQEWEGTYLEEYVRDHGTVIDKPQDSPEIPEAAQAEIDRLTEDNKRLVADNERLTAQVEDYKQKYETLSGRVSRVEQALRLRGISLEELETEAADQEEPVVVVRTRRPDEEAPTPEPTLEPETPPAPAPQATARATEPTVDRPARTVVAATGAEQPADEPAVEPAGGATPPTDRRYNVNPSKFAKFRSRLSRRPYFSEYYRDERGNPYIVQGGQRRVITEYDIARNQDSGVGVAAIGAVALAILGLSIYNSLRGDENEHTRQARIEHENNPADNPSVASSKRLEHLRQIAIDARNTANKKLDIIRNRQKAYHEQEVKIAKYVYNRERLALASILHQTHQAKLLDLGVDPKSSYFQKFNKDYAKKYGHKKQNR